MTQFLTPEQVLRAGSAACGFQVVVRDQDLFEASVARPQVSAFGADAYPTLFFKAAALLHGIARNHPLVDGNKRTAWNAAWVFLAVNGVPVTDDLNNDMAEEFMIRASTEDLAIGAIAEVLKLFTA